MARVLLRPMDEEAQRLGLWSDFEVWGGMEDMIKITVYKFLPPPPYQIGIYDFEQRNAAGTIVIDRIATKKKKSN